MQRPLDPTATCKWTLSKDIAGCLHFGAHYISIGFSICPQGNVKIDFELFLDNFVLEYHSLVVWWAPA